MVLLNRDDVFPSIGSSFRFHPPTPLFTFNAPIPTLATPAADRKPLTPLSAATSVDFPSSAVTDAPFAWITAFIPHQSDSSTASSSTAVPAATLSPPQTIQQGMGTISKGAQIGIFICIAVVVVLVLLALGLVILSFRRRLKRRQAKKQNRNSELNMWETELRNGRQGVSRDRDRATDGKVGGLWAGLKVGENQRKEHYTDAENMIVERERMGSNGTMWERVGERKQEKTREREEGATREVHSKEQGIQTYIPRDRRSMVSEGSVGVLGNPVTTVSFLDDRR